MSHDWDNMSIKMIKICGDAIALPVMLVPETALKEKKFPDMEKANVVSVHKKEKKLFKNYRPISLILIFSKVFEKIIYNLLTTLSVINFLHFRNLVIFQVIRV